MSPLATESELDRKLSSDFEKALGVNRLGEYAPWCTMTAMIILP